MADGKESIGLKNIQARVRLMYGEAYGLKIQNLQGKGSSVTVRLPKLTTGALPEKQTKGEHS